MSKQYHFYGHEHADCLALSNDQYPGIRTPKDLSSSTPKWCLADVI